MKEKEEGAGKQNKGGKEEQGKDKEKKKTSKGREKRRDEQRKGGRMEERRRGARIRERDGWSYARIEERMWERTEEENKDGGRPRGKVQSSVDNLDLPD